MAALAAVVAAVAAFAFLRLADASLPPAGPILNGADLDAYFFPAASFLRSCLLDGELPLWNPYQFAGSPFLAAHATGAAYPPMLLFALAPPHVALTMMVVFHQLLLGMFTFAFGRSTGLTTAGAAAMALTFVFSYSAVGSVHNVAYLSTFAWVPAVLWGVQAVVNVPNAARAAGLALVVAMSLVSGYSQASLYTLQVAAVFGGVLLLRQGLGRRSAVTLGWLATGAVLGAAAAAVQLLPALELASLGVRSIHGMSIDMADPLDWRFIHEGDFQNLLLGRERGLIHPPPLFFAAIALAVLPRGRRLLGGFFLVLLLVAFDFARGRDGWVFPLYFQLPLGNIFRLPARTIFLIDLSIAALSGIAVSNVARLSDGRTSLKLLAAGLALAAGGSAFVRNPLAFRFDPLTDSVPLYEQGSLKDFAQEAARTQQRMFVQRAITGLASRNFGTAHGAFVVPGYDPILPATYKSYFAIPATELWHGKLDVIDLGRFSRPWTIQDPRLLDLLSVRFYVDALGSITSQAPNPFLQRVVGSPPINAEPPRIYPRTSALPRTYVVHDIVRADGDDDALARVRRLAFDPRRQVVLTDSGAPEPEPAPPAAPESAEIVSYRRNSVEIDATCASSCVVVLTDLWYPGWNVTVDARPEKILRANYLLRAVSVAAGTHRIRFEYAPASFWTGLLLTAIAFAAIVALAAAGRFPRGPRSAVLRGSGRSAAARSLDGRPSAPEPLTRSRAGPVVLAGPSNHRNRPRISPKCRIW